MKTPRFTSLVTAWMLASLASVFAQTDQAFDGRPWNISSGNLSVSFIQRSPIGAFPEPNFFEPAPSVESQARLKGMGLVANEDYIAWGSVEREPGKWNWKQHDDIEANLHQAGLKYVVYNWAHFPPVWLREQKDKRTLMRCVEHGQEANYLSIFDPRTIKWYDHFYKNVRAHFGDRVDDIYACILGPYGEGNYPLQVTAWVNMGHCHEGYWCADDYAIKAFQQAMKRTYSSIATLNKAWGSAHESFEEIRPPREIAQDKFKPSLAAFPSSADKRRWLDFITWYHQVIVDFSEQSIKTVLKYFPAKNVRLKPGGNAGSVNPLPWGTYCPAYARMARKFGIVLQPADCQGAVFGDKWVGTAYQFYGVKQCTEPAGDLDDRSFVRRMFSDASCGAAELFTYQFERHAPNVRKYIHLYTGEPGETEIAVYCPTTLYRLGASLQWTIEASVALRDLCEFDVLDELLITDGALKARKYKALVIFQGDVIDRPVLKKFDAYLRAGGKIVIVGDTKIRNVEGAPWAKEGKAARLASAGNGWNWRKELTPLLAGLKGMDAKVDGLWVSRRGNQMFAYNTTTNMVETKINFAPLKVEPGAIWSGSLPARTK